MKHIHAAASCGTSLWANRGPRLGSLAALADLPALDLVLAGREEVDELRAGARGVSRVALEATPHAIQGHRSATLGHAALTQAERITWLWQVIVAAE